MTFKDHFSENSSGYNKYRPQYPDELFQYLAQSCNKQKLAWDCATGSGQAALGLAAHFSRVIATDASRQQIAKAVRDEQITYNVATAEQSGLIAASVDLITVAQALHWFDCEAFCEEAKRVLKKDALLCVWSYNLLSIDKQIDEMIHFLYRDILGSYWPPERRLVEEGYAQIKLSLPELSCPVFKMEASWSLADLIGYLNTWSAVRRYIKKQGSNPVELIVEKLQASWGDSSLYRPIEWPLTLRMWQNSDRAIDSE